MPSGASRNNGTKLTFHDYLGQAWCGTGSTKCAGLLTSCDQQMHEAATYRWATAPAIIWPTKETINLLQHPRVIADVFAVFTKDHVVRNQVLHEYTLPSLLLTTD